MKNGQPSKPIPPHIRIVTQEVEGGLMVDGKVEPGRHWVTDVIVHVGQGHYGNSFIFKSYDDMVAAIPEILKNVKDKFYDKLIKPESTPCEK